MTFPSFRIVRAPLRERPLVTSEPIARAKRRRVGRSWLATQAELADEGAVALEVVALQVLQEPPTTADHDQQAATRVVVVAVLPHVVRELVDAVREQRDLNRRRAGVGRGAAEPLDQLLLAFL